MNRRRFFTATTATGLTLGLAGCLGVLDSDDGDDTGNGDDGDDTGNGDDGDDTGNGDPEMVPPTAAFSWSPSDPEIGEDVTFDATDSEAPDTEITDFRWTIDGEELTGESVTRVFAQAGGFEVLLEVEDDIGETDTTTETVTVAEPAELDTLVDAVLSLAEELDELSRFDSLHNPDRLEGLQAQRDAIEPLLNDAETAGTSTEALTAAQDIFTFQSELVETHERDIEARTLYMDTTFATADILVSEGIDLDALDDNMESFDELDGLLSERVAIQESLASPNVETTPLGEEMLAYDQAVGTYTRYDSEHLDQIITRISDVTGDLRAGTEMFHGIAQAEEGQWENARNRFSQALSIMADAPELPEETPAAVEDFLGPAFSDDVSSDDRDFVGILESMLSAAEAEDIDALDDEVEHLLEVTSFQR